MSAIKERPILFSAPMVRAILDGRKTQTRRVVKHAEEYTHVDRDIDPVNRLPFFRFSYSEGSGVQSTVIEFPYGTVGDRLWVRETWCPLRPGDYHDNSKPKEHRVACCEGAANGAAYRADTDSDPTGDSERCRLELGYKKWTPSIFMPRWASRITLEVTGVRVERLQAITPDDCFAEGLSDPDGKIGWAPSIAPMHFGKLWDGINGKKHPWESNPWVWVIEFKRLAR